MDTTKNITKGLEECSNLHKLPARDTGTFTATKAKKIADEFNSENDYGVPITKNGIFMATNMLKEIKECAKEGDYEKNIFESHNWCGLWMVLKDWKTAKIYLESLGYEVQLNDSGAIKKVSWGNQLNGN